MAKVLGHLGRMSEQRARGRWVTQCSVVAVVSAEHCRPQVNDSVFFQPGSQTCSYLEVAMQCKQSV
eukprot:4153585-Alexandrium_andersonii.AAC.1